MEARRCDVARGHVGPREGPSGLVLFVSSHQRVHVQFQEVDSPSLDTEAVFDEELD